VARSDPHAQIRYLGEASHSDPLFLKLISTRTTTSPSSSLPLSQRSKSGDPNTICNRFNDGKPHGPCPMRHACRRCKKEGHRESECQSGGGPHVVGTGGNAQAVGTVRGGAIVGAGRGMGKK
jgi:hypothetical protein